MSVNCWQWKTLEYAYELKLNHLTLLLCKPKIVLNSQGESYESLWNLADLRMKRDCDQTVLEHCSPVAAIFGLKMRYIWLRILLQAQRDRVVFVSDEYPLKTVLSERDFKMVFCRKLIKNFRRDTTTTHTLIISNERILSVWIQSFKRIDSRLVDK